MVEAIDIDPRAHVVASFASQGRAIGAQFLLLLLKFTVMGILMAAGAAHVFPTEWKDLIGSPGGSDLVTVSARHGGVGSRQCETSVAMLCDGKERAVKITDGMAILAFIGAGSSGELAVMGILVAIGTERKFHLVNGVLAGG